MRQLLLNIKGEPWTPDVSGISRQRAMLTRMSDKNDTLPDDQIARRMERVVRRFLEMPPQPHGKNPKSPPPPKPKERPAGKGRIHKAKSRS
jgi:hypothetical protein